ncbi:MAG: crotonobetainyl-CoA:carnitine CoA-transferase CaiB-like acyl-CoA transferase [Alcanivorax sp.]|jgi:crotonobetainyl-CoA:carnitine CoA-transferase CaiB-like acyl-CoA transferase
MKLEGLTVIDLSLFLPGPAVSLMMADHGARVIKVENPASPEPTRSSQFFPWTQGESTVMFRTTQRGKESLTLNLKSPRAKELLLELAATADVFIESFRPGVMKRLGIDYDVIRAINPKIVYCSLSAFGQDGPWRDKPAHDTAAVAAAGVLSLTRSPSEDSGPAIIGVAISDMLSSHLAFGGIMMALYRRHTSGEGDYIDISMFESVLNASPNIVGPVFSAGETPDRLQERTHGGNAMLNIYELSDGNHIALGGGEHKFVEALFNGLGCPEFVQVVTGPAGQGHHEAIAFLRETFKQRSRPEWEAWFEGRDICWMPVMTLDEAWDTEHVWAREMRIRDEQGNDHMGIPIKFRNEPGGVQFGLAKVGEHTESILTNLGCSAGELATLRAEGAI